jgi:type III pantothenate kinase
MSIPFLLVDAGNTRVKWATAKAAGPIRVVGDINTKDASTAWILSLAKKFPAHRLVLASVVPKLIPHFRRAFAKRMEIVSSASPALGLKFDYPKPAHLGADRLAAAVAAYTEQKWPVIVVNCGTATAFTVLDARGRLCGGVIAPGLQTQLASLIGATAQLPEVALRVPTKYLGRSTEEAIRIGVMLNFQGGVKEILDRLISELPAAPSPHLILTGGHARHLVGAFDHSAMLRPLLVFEGLRIIGLRAFKETEMS